MIITCILDALCRIISMVQNYTFFFTYKTFLLFFINKVIKQCFF